MNRKICNQIRKNPGRWCMDTLSGNKDHHTLEMCLLALACSLLESEDMSVTEASDFRVSWEEMAGLRLYRMAWDTAFGGTYPSLFIHFPVSPCSGQPLTWSVHPCPYTCLSRCDGRIHFRITLSLEKGGRERAQQKFTTELEKWILYLIKPKGIHLNISSVHLGGNNFLPMSLLYLPHLHEIKELTSLNIQVTPKSSPTILANDYN